MGKYFDQTPGELDKWLEFIDEDLENVRRVIEKIQENSIDAEFVIHAKSETVEESAHAMEMEEGKIVKTLVFITSGEPVAVMMPGDSQLDEQKLAELTGADRVRMANPSEVEDATGYIVGGVSPFDLSVPVYMEESILERSEVKPAAGSRVVGVELTPEDLREATGAEVAELSR